MILLLGQADADTFVFGDAHGADRIADFEQGIDTIEYDISSGVFDFSNLTITQTGAHVLISSSAGTIAVNNSLVADFDASDFSFATPPLAEPLKTSTLASVQHDEYELNDFAEMAFFDSGDFFL